MFIFHENNLCFMPFLARVMMDLVIAIIPSAYNA